MSRRYDKSIGIPRDVVDAVVDAGLRGPSAGFSQGTHFLVLDDPASVDRYWKATTDGGPVDEWLSGMSTAPVLVVVYSDRERYENRYSEADKQRDPSGLVTLERRWPVPYWHLDAAMAALLVQLAATDAGLACCWFGVPTDRVASVSAAFAVPAGLTPVGVVSLGYPPAPAPVTPPFTPRRRRPRAEMVSHGRYGS